MNKKEINEMQKREITEIMNYFKANKLTSKDDPAIDRLEEAIRRVFQLEVENTEGDNKENDLSIEFIDGVDNMQGARCNPIDKKVRYSKTICCMKLDSDDKNIRLAKCKQIFETIFHEIQHHRQYLMTQSDIGSKNGMIFARDMILQLCMKRCYADNYDVFAIEKDAGYFGYKRYLEIMEITDDRTANLMDINDGYFENANYKFAGKDKDVYQIIDRDMAATKLLDLLICDRKMTEILSMYPIFQKVYNLDGTKKNVLELIRNMNVELQTCKEELASDVREMYYELIYNQLQETTPEEIEKIIEEVGDNELSELIKRMLEYFSKEKDRKIEASIKMAKAQENEPEEGFILPSNKGSKTIKMEKDEGTVELSFDEFIQTLDTSLLEKKFIIPNLDGNVEIGAEDFLKKYFLKFIPQDGKLTLKNGQEISAKQFIEQYILALEELKVDYPPERILKDLLKSESPWKMQAGTQKKLEKIYEIRQKTIKMVNKQMLQGKNGTFETIEGR